MGSSASRVVGRYMLHGEIASGGMATVHFGRLLGPVGFSRTVAIKRLHPQFAKNPEFVSMFLDEARLAARIRHPNVVQTLDVVATEGELFLVLDYVQGESLSRLGRLEKQRGKRIPPRIVVAVIGGVLHGLHAAHEAKNERGEPLNLVHRDVSPQNVLIGVDGVARVLDFGVAKATGRIQTTREGHLKGKIAYMAPEQFRGETSRQTDVFAAGIVAWEALTGEKLFAGGDEMETLGRALAGDVKPPSTLVQGLSTAFDDVLLRALAPAPKDRFATAREMALALERCDVVAPPSEVGEWVEGLASGTLSERAEALNMIESSSPSIEVDSAKIATAIAAGDGGRGKSVSVAPPSVGTVGGVEATPQANPRRSMVGIGAIAACVIAGVVVLALRMSGGSSNERAAAAVSSASPPAVVAPSAPPETPPASTAAPGPSASASVAVAETADAQPQRHSAAPARAHASAAPAAKPHKADCDPPFTIDASGHKHFKVDCL